MRLSNINNWGQRKGYNGHTSHMMELLVDSYVEPRSDPQTEIMEKKDLFETKANGRSDGKAKEKFLVLISETTFVGVESRVLIPETTFVGVESRVLIPETTVWDTLVYPSDTLVIRKQKLE
ncbi:hypothetical protein Tco_1236472 [Tanacetum coccineum]